MIRLLVNILVFVINVLYKDRPYPRFYVLETVARVPYFSYLSVLHLYETLGWWRGVDWLKVHLAKSSFRRVLERITPFADYRSSWRG